MGNGGARSRYLRNKHSGGRPSQQSASSPQKNEDASHANYASISYVNHLIPLNGVEDRSKMESIRAGMARDGWQGAPLVRWGDQLLTGSHRYAAAVDLGWGDHEVPTVDVHDVFREAGQNFDQTMADAGHPGLYDSAFGDAIAEALPVETLHKYGLHFG